MNWWIEEYKKYHAELNTNYPGNNLKPQLQHIVDLVKDTKSTTLLDYGCGKGLQYTKWKHHEELGVMPALYDPAIPEYEELPDGQFDGVYSTDAICTKPAIAILPSGENAHCTVEPIGFWKTMVEKYAPKRVYTHIKTYGNCNNYSILNEDLYLEWYLDQF